MKKTIIILLICIIGLPSPIFAGDIPEALMLGEEQALFIGELTHKGPSTYRLKPLTIMMGYVDEEEIEVNSFEKYYGTDDLPKASDIVVVVLEEDNLINTFWLFKATSRDYRTLKLVSEKYNMVKRYETYINEGKYFEAQERLDQEAQGKNKDTQNSQVDEKALKIDTTEVDGKTPVYNQNTLFIIVGATIAVVLYIAYKRRLNKKNGQ